MQEKENQDCLLWHWYRTTAQGLKTRIEKHVVLQGVESIKAPVSPEVENSLWDLQNRPLPFLHVRMCNFSGNG